MTDKERLENMSPIGFDLDGNVLLKGEDYHWLMERVQELEETVENYKTVNKELHQRGRKVRKQNKHYREAINNINEKAMLFGTSEEVYDAIQDAIKVLEESK